ncbi:MAG TPA: hypothetical protein VFV08_04650 [Puia sp.]|nr:hypothetical protein [Puia sp.]
MKITRNVAIKVGLAFSLGIIAGYFLQPKISQWFAKKASTPTT